MTHLIIAFIVMPALLVLSGCGNGTLSRSQAESMIEEKLEKAKELPTKDIQVGRHWFRFKENNGGKSCLIAMADSDSWLPGSVAYATQGTNWSEAAQQGYITAELVGVHIDGFSKKEDALICQIAVTDKARPFIKESRNDIITLSLADSAAVKVTGVTKPADMFGHTISEAEYQITYKPNNLGDALRKNNENLMPSRDRKAAFQLFDDGWRLN